MNIQKREIDNPYFDPRYAESRDNPRTIEVPYNARESSIAAMYAREQISYEQFAAAERFRMIYEKSGQGGVRALDWTKERVDGGRVTDGLPASRIDALTELKALEKVLGRFSYKLCVHIVGERKGIKETASEILGSNPPKGEVEKYGWLLRQSLDVLAVEWGFKQAGHLTMTGA